MINLIYDFAKENGISISDVDKFLERKKTITNLAELESAPQEFLNHYRDFSECPEKIKNFIRDNLDWNRKETVKLYDVLEYIRGQFDYADDYKTLLDTECNKELNSLIDELILSKFGSLICDW